MKKKKGLFNAIFTIVAIISIVVALVLIPKNDEDNEDTNNTTTKESYATSFSINLPSIIEISVGSSIKFLTGYITVSPNSMLEKLSYEISSTNTENGIKFENNILTANTTGDYTIKFKMPKAKSTYYTKSILVKVCENCVNTHINLVNNSIVNGKSTQLNEMFEIKDAVNYSVKTDNKVTLDNNVITAHNVGESNITFLVVEDYIEYAYNFILNVKKEPEYVILLNNVTNNSITINMAENDAFHINYEILDKNMENVTQGVVVDTYNENIVVIESILDDALIKIKAVSFGKTTLRISIETNLTIFVEINIIVQ